MTDPIDDSIFGRQEFETRRSRRQNGGHRAPRKRRKGLVTVVVSAVTVLAVVFAFFTFKPVYDSWVAPNDFEGDGDGSISVVVKPGDSGRQIGETLEKAGVVKSVAAFTEALNESKGDEIQPGTYNLRKEMKASTALSMLRGTGRDMVKVVIREGLWKTEVYNELSKATGVPRAEYDAVDQKSASDPSLLGLPAAAKGSPEGWLFPATYTFDKGTPAIEQVKKLVAMMKSKLVQLGVPADKQQVVLIKASLVEAEARHAPDGPKVARVLENRLSKTPPMKLQLDSTSMYGVQQRTGVAYSSEQMRQANNGYNTYVIEGLPAGPIGNPGEHGIKSVMNPAVGTWLYFVTVNPESGETVFTGTLAEHDVQVGKLNAWCRAHRGKC